MSVTYCIPSESYEILENEAREAVRMGRSRGIYVAGIEADDKNSEKKEEIQKGEKTLKIE
jgi:hypothetical protein